MPIALSRSVNHSEFVSRRNGVNISEPMAMISALSIRLISTARVSKRSVLGMIFVQLG